MVLATYQPLDKSFVRKSIFTAFGFVLLASTIIFFLFKTDYGLSLMPAPLLTFLLMLIMVRPVLSFQGNKRATIKVIALPWIIFAIYLLFLIFLQGAYVILWLTNNGLVYVAVIAVHNMFVLLLRKSYLGSSKRFFLSVLVVASITITIIGWAHASSLYGFYFDSNKLQNASLWECKKLKYSIKNSSYSKECEVIASRKAIQAGNPKNGLKTSFQLSVKAINYFNEVGFYNNAVKKLERVSTDTYPYATNDSISSEDEACLVRVFERIEKLTSFSMPRAQKNPRGTTNAGKEYGYFYFVFQPGAIPPTEEETRRPSDVFPPIRRVLDNVRLYHKYSYSSRGYDLIPGSTIYVNTDLSAKERCALIYRGVAISLGLQPTGISDQESVLFAKGVRNDEFSPVDEEVIQILFNPLVMAGDNPEVVHRILSR